MRDHVCKFCKKGFSTEKTLARHLCVKKKRSAEQDTVGARIGLQVFVRFHELTSNSKKPKTVEDFIDSSFYADFVKFGRYLVELDPIHPSMFIDFVIKNAVKITDWNKEYVYQSYLDDLVKKEKAESAVERTIMEMQEWCDKNDCVLQEFFAKISPVEATFKIKAGRLSPWVLYLASSAEKLLIRMSEEQGKIMSSAIDPGTWNVKFMLAPDSVEFVRDLLENAGL